MGVWYCCFFQAEDGIGDLAGSRVVGEVYKRQVVDRGVGVGGQMGALGRRRASGDPASQPLAVPVPDRVEDARARAAVAVHGSDAGPDDAVGHFDEDGGDLRDLHV